MNKFNFLTLTIYGLSVFRLAVLLADDSGPWRFISKFRLWLKREEKKSPALKKSDVASGVECIRCNGLWFALPIATYAHCRRFLADWVVACVDIFLVALALSALAILFQRAFPKR